MKSILNVIKKAFLWSYPRNTWQWDVLCVLILIFIFLSPKSWFESSERAPKFGHQSPATSTVIIGAEVVGTERDNSQIEKRVRVLTGQPNAHVLAVRPRQDSSGNTIAYEVDIDSQ
jgi:hypothetical protein